MFSFYVNNPNNFTIQNDYTVIPFGHRCTSAISCKYASIRKFSLPFDWTSPTLPKKIQNILENNFIDFIPDVYNGNFFNKYDVCLVHFNKNLQIGIDEYKRRIERFNNIIHLLNHKYFVYINEDYFYNSSCRQDDFNDNVFQEMLDLEIFLKNKYPNLNFNILYFNFKHHNIPNNSNIINIVLTSNKLYELENDAPVEEVEEFRIFCGRILTEIFNTNLTLGQEYDVYNN